METEAEFTSSENRPAVWIDWIEKLKANCVNVETPEGQIISFRDAFNRSKALTLSLNSLLEDMNGIQFIKVLFGFVFGKHLNEEKIESLVFVIKQLVSDKMDQNLKTLFVESLEKFKFFDSLQISEEIKHLNKDQINEENLEKTMKEFRIKIRLFAQFLQIKPKLEEKVQFSSIQKIFEPHFLTKKKFEEQFSLAENKKNKMIENSFGSFPSQLTENEKLKKELNQLEEEEKVLLERLETLRNKKSLLKEKISSNLQNIGLSQIESPHLIESFKDLTELGKELNTIKQNIEMTDKKIFHFNNVFQDSFSNLVEKNNQLATHLSSSHFYQQISHSAFLLLSYFKQKFEEMIKGFSSSQAKTRINVKNNFERLKLKYQEMSGSVQATLNSSFTTDQDLRDQITSLKNWIDSAQLSDKK